MPSAAGGDPRFHFFAPKNNLIIDMNWNDLKRRILGKSQTSPNINQKNFKK